MRFIFSMIALVALIPSCRKPTGSSFGTVSSAAVAPPPLIRASSAGFSLGASGKKLGDGGGQCRILPDGSVDCGGGGDTPSEQPSEQPTVTATPLPPSLIRTPDVDLNSEKWFVGDKTAYYQKLKGFPDIQAQFDQSGKATGYFYDTRDQKLAQLSDGGIDPSTGKMRYGANDIVYQMSQNSSYQGGWKGDQQRLIDQSKQQLEPTGLSFFYGRLNETLGQSTPGSSVPTTKWGHFYQVDPNAYGKSNPQAGIVGYLGEQKQNQPVLLREPPQYFKTGDTPQVFQLSDLSKFFSILQPSQPQQPQRYTQPQNQYQQQPPSQQFPQQNPQSGRQILVTAPFHCPPCEVAKADARNNPNIRIVVDTRPSSYGVSSYPTYLPDW
jgi:hypothetical protein